MEIINAHFKMYEEVAGARLNQDKMEGVWLGYGRPNLLNIEKKMTNGNCRN